MRLSIALIVLTLFVIAEQRASADFVIAGWTFETNPPTTAGPHAANVGTGTATSNTGGSFTNPVGYGSADSWSSNRWDLNEYFQFSVSTTGRSNIRIDWAQTGSNTGPRDFQLQYQVNGAGFSNVLDYSLTPFTSSSWSATASSGHDFGYDFSAITAVNNATTVDFRFAMRTNTSIEGETIGTTGSSRVDNVFVTAVPEPSALLLFGISFVPRVLMRRRPSQAE